ncbi:MAG: hypothetical protein KAT00_08450, partial [Planctomycetes bacterium]|nr:hypothetical protein [Planctomycetota bacterium]
VNINPRLSGIFRFMLTLKAQAFDVGFWVFVLVGIGFRGLAPPAMLCFALSGLIFLWVSYSQGVALGCIVFAPLGLWNFSFF